MHPEATPGQPKPSPYFLAGSIQASGSSIPVVAPKQAAAAAPQQGTSGAVAAAAVAGAGAVAAPRQPPLAARRLKLSKNELVSSSVTVMFIPIAGVIGSGAACPSTAIPLSTVASVKRAVFEELRPRGVTVGSTFKRCSYNTSRLTIYGTAWTFDKCDFDDLTGYADAAEEVLRRRGYNPDAYAHKCSGPDDCRVCISADFWTTPNAMAHELGHNLFLAHAGAVSSAGVFDEYADMSGIMGYCCSDRCPNTPHAWQLGWITLQEVNWTSLVPGQTLTFNINSQSLSRQTGLRLTDLPGSDPVFLGYRTRAGGDASATPDIAGYLGGPGRLHIYTANITNTWDSEETTKQATLESIGQSWALRLPGLVVRLVRASNTAALVTLCRRAGPETLASCQAGLDNDCNGKAGSQDAACQLLLPRRARAAPLKRTLRGL
ncbi:hypothetical protein ABPG75_010534 [Micractinium tetrahymenae]